MNSAVLDKNQQAISAGHINGGEVVNRTPESMRGKPGSTSMFRLRGGSKPVREMDRSDIERFEAHQVGKLHTGKSKVVAKQNSVPPHLLMTALLEQLCHMHVPNDKDSANKVFKMLCEKLIKLNVISPLSHLDEMRHLRKQHGITFKRLMVAALHSIKQTQIVRALPGILVPGPIPNRGERVLLQEELIEEYSSRYEDEFEELEHIGQGGFGSVFKVRNNLDKRCYAIKKIRFKQKNHELLQKLLREVRVLAHLQHTNIVGYNSAWIESHNPFSSSKGTSSENTASQGMSMTENSPRDKKITNDSQSVEFLDDYDSDSSSRQENPPSGNIRISPRIPLAFGAKMFSQVKDHNTFFSSRVARNVITTSSTAYTSVLSTSTTTTAAAKKTVIASSRDDFNLFDFKECSIMDITELSSSQYSSTSSSSSIGDFIHPSHKNIDSSNKTNAEGNSFIKFKTSSTRVTDNDDSDSDIGSHIDKRASKRSHSVSTGINRPTKESEYIKSTNNVLFDDDGNDDDEDVESQMSSTGFSVTDEALRQMSITSDLSSDIPYLSSQNLFPMGSTVTTDSQSMDITPNNISQHLLELELPLSQQHNFINSDCQESVCKTQMDNKTKPSSQDQLHNIAPGPNLPSSTSSSSSSSNVNNNIPHLTVDTSSFRTQPTSAIDSTSDVNSNRDCDSKPPSENQVHIIASTPNFPSSFSSNASNNIPHLTFDTSSLKTPPPSLPPTSSSIASSSISDMNSNKNMQNCFSGDEKITSENQLSLVPLRGKFHVPQRCVSYSGTRNKGYSSDGELGISAGDPGSLLPPYCLRSISNLEEDRFRGAGESKDHSYDFQNSIVLYIQMELCFQTLCEWLVERNDKVDLKTAYHDALCANNMIIFRQLLEGVNFIHSNGLIHRDLKPRNIFLSGNNLHVKIGDFGLAKEEELNDGKKCSILSPDCTRQYGPPFVKKQHTTGVGTTGYAAPEQIHGSVYNAKSDMYSLGVVLFEMFNVFMTDMERTESIKNPTQSSCLADILARWPKQTEAICCLTHEDPVQRPLSCQLLQGGLFLSQEQEIQGLKQTIQEKDKTIESLQRQIRLLKAERDENIFRGFFSYIP